MDKSFVQTSADLESAVKRHGFGCCMSTTWGPHFAAKTWPCISMFTEQDKTKLGLITPVRMLSALSPDAALLQVAEEVERATVQMVDEAIQLTRH